MNDSNRGRIRSVCNVQLVGEVSSVSLETLATEAGCRGWSAPANKWGHSVVETDKTEC